GGVPSAAGGGGGARGGGAESRAGGARWGWFVRGGKRGLRGPPQDPAQCARRPRRRGCVRGGRDRSPGAGRDARAGRLGSAGRAMKFHAHAKLTLSLHVTGVRADGYHELDALMVRLSETNGAISIQPAPQTA